MSQKPYFVEARMDVKTGKKVIAYRVWRATESGPYGAGRHVHEFSCARKGGWQVALHLANLMRDDMNTKELAEEPTSEETPGTAPDYAMDHAIWAARAATN